MKLLTRDFYTRDTITVARELIGKYMVHEYEGEPLVCRITETEAYCGPEDKACHAYGFKDTPRTRALYAEGGYSYVYFIYGMYYCMNVVTERKGFPCAVLIRGGEALKGLDTIARLRFGKNFGELTKAQERNLLNGPGKLCRGLHITKEDNGLDLLQDNFYIYEEEEEKKPYIETSRRINIAYAQEYAEKEWRFLEKKRAK